MPRPSLRFLAGAVLLAVVSACSEPPPAATPPKAIRPVTPVSQTGSAGAALPGGITVQVFDYSDRTLAGVKVGFSIVNGDGSLSQRLVLTDGEGRAHVEWTLGQTAGPNEVVAGIFGLDSTARFLATGAAGAAAGLTITPRIVRIQPSANADTVTARVVDQYGNNVAGTPTYASRNTGVATVASNGVVTVTGNRGTSTWVVMTAAGFTDSAQVFNLAATDPPCTGIPAMATLAVGEVKMTGFYDNGICVAAAAGDREFALVPFFNSPVPSAQTVLTVSGFGVRTAITSLAALRSYGLAARPSGEDASASRAALDRRLRIAERREMTSRAAGAREWYSTRTAVTGRRANFATVPVVGDQLQLNVNATDFCASPSMRTGRVVAVTSKAVVLADMANPAGGFTDADYQSLGASFDTLVYEINETNFGAPTDIDENGGRVLLFFTHAVNELGPGTLGFAYSRDLLPKVGPLGSCPGSNVAEMINIYVPDASNSVSSVRVNAIATMGHELQHVINAARRLYVNTTGAPVEERWLNEGLSHVAEELLFYRSAGVTPRQNLGSALSTQYQAAYINFQRQNFNRYFRFTRMPGLQSPVGLNDDDDDVETRGAIWSFLRYAADHRFAADEPAFWRSLVNSSSIGLQNLLEHIGADTRLLVRDWALSNYLDDLVPTDAKYTQPSWHLRQSPDFQVPVTLQLAPNQAAPTTGSIPVTLRALSSEFVRFGVPSNLEAYVQASGFPASANAPLPRNVLLAIVRTK